MEIIEINNANELPSGMTFILYEPPFQSSDEQREIVSEFSGKYGYEPHTIYRLGKKWYVLYEKRGIEMDLLEKMKLMAVGNKMALEDSPAICSAVLAAMDEMKGIYNVYLYSEYNKVKDAEYYIGISTALSILRKHLGVDK